MVRIRGFEINVTVIRYVLINQNFKLLTVRKLNKGVPSDIVLVARKLFFVSVLKNNFNFFAVFTRICEAVSAVIILIGNKTVFKVADNDILNIIAGIIGYLRSLTFVFLNCDYCACFLDITVKIVFYSKKKCSLCQIIDSAAVIIQSIFFKAISVS